MVKRALLLTAGLLLLLPLYATFAQDQGVGTPTPSPSPTPEAGVIQRHGAELIFPVELEFFLIITAPQQDILGGEVVLSQENGYEASFPLELADDLNFAGEESLEIRKTILFDLDNAPRPFERLDYEWRVTTAAGANDQTDNLENWILFQPDGVTWQQTATDELTLHWHLDHLAAEEMRAELLPVSRLIDDHTGDVADLDFAIYGATFDICIPSLDANTGEEVESVLVYPGRPEYPCSVNDIANYYASHDIALIQPDDPGFDNIQQAIIAELVRETYASQWVGRGVPAWFASGLSQLYRPNGNAAALNTVRNAEGQNFLLPPARLQSALPSDADAYEQRLWEAQSYTLVLYLADNFGADAPFDLATAFPEAESFEAAVENITGMSLAENFRVWRQWLRTESAASAATWHPYLTTTAALDEG